MRSGSDYVPSMAGVRFPANAVKSRQCDFAVPSARSPNATSASSFASSTISGLGDGISVIALVFAVLQVSDSAIALGLVLAARQIADAAIVLAAASGPTGSLATSS